MSARVPRLQSNLEVAIRSASTRHEADCARADLAAQLARSGRLAEAEEMVADLRDRYKSVAHKHVIPWLNFAEAYIDLGWGRGDDALLKLRRAHALSVSAELPLAAFSAASLAHRYWNREHIENAVYYAKEALRLAADDDYRTLCRTSMTIAEMLAMSRCEEMAVPWFARARSHAMTSGDDLALGAFVLNISVVHTDLLRQALCEGTCSDDKIKRAVLSAQTWDELKAMFAINLTSHDTIQQAQLMSCTGRYAEASAIFEAQIDKVKLASSSRSRAQWLSELAWCLFNVNRSPDSRSVANNAINALTPDTQIDDRAAMHSRLAQVFGGLGDSAEAARHQALADDCWGQYRAFQDRCAALCEPFTHYAGD